jgi:hypothetical protein
LVVRIFRRSFAIAGVVGIAGFGAHATAAPVSPGHWELLEPASAGSPGKTADPAVFRTADGILHVAWIHQSGPLDQSLLTESFAADGTLPGLVSTAAAHWANLSDGAFLEGVGGPRLFFGGQLSTTYGSPLGLMTATTVGQNWSPPAEIANTYGTVSAAPGSGAVTYQAFESGSRPAVHVGLAPSPLLFPTSGIPGIAEASPSIVSDGTQATVAWCAFGDGTGGVFTQRLDLISNQMVGSPAVLPDSTTSYGGVQHATCVLQSEVSRRTPMAGRKGGGVFVAGTTGYPMLTGVVVWKVGGATLVADRSSVAHSEPEVIADPSGRIWVGWVQAGSRAPVLVVRRSNPTATVLGAPVTVKAPGSGQLGSFEANATARQLDVIAQFTATGANSIQHTIILPGLTLQRLRTTRRSHGRVAVTYRVLDAGDPVAGAKVTNGLTHGTTAANGKVTLRMKRSTRATATKPGYTKATV